MVKNKKGRQAESGSAKEKPRTRWGCIIAVFIIVLILGGASYLFYVYIYPVIQKQLTQEGAYTPPAINKEGKEMIEGIKDYGEPIKDSETTGRADPFAPI